MTPTTLEQIDQRFGTVIEETYIHNPRRAYITVGKARIPDVCRYLHEELGGRLAIATATDLRSGIEILYHFMFGVEHLMVTVKTFLAKPQPSIESVGAFYKAVEWIEREIYDILGVTFTGHPDPRRILMADDWPADVFPLRRDFTGLNNGDQTHVDTAGRSEP